MIYYNEFNPESAAMIQKFMDDGLIAPGKVDTRSITEIDPDELKRYTQCHFFAGIAGWTFALQLAGWPTDRPVWTGSCPCQPFSAAGRQEGKNDERHLWPVWERLITECRPASVYGEQVASAIAHGWLDDVYQGLEAEGYAVASAVLPAVSVGAPHKRDRLWFVAHAEEQQLDRNTGKLQGAGRQAQQKRSEHRGDSKINVGDPDINGRDQGRECIAASGHDGVVGNGRALGYTSGTRSPTGLSAQTCGSEGQSEKSDNGSNRSVGPWDTGEWIACPDGKSRLVEPSIPLLAHGFQHRRPILHAIGNAIVPQVAAKFIEATM